MQLGSTIMNLINNHAWLHVAFLIYWNSNLIFQLIMYGSVVFFF